MTQQELWLAMSLGCVLKENSKGRTTQFFGGSQIKENLNRRDYNFSRPQHWRIVDTTKRYRFVKFVLGFMLYKELPVRGSDSQFIINDAALRYDVIGKVASALDMRPYEVVDKITDAHMTDVLDAMFDAENDIVDLISTEIS